MNMCVLQSSFLGGVLNTFEYMTVMTTLDTWLALYPCNVTINFIKYAVSKQKSYIYTDLCKAQVYIHFTILLCYKAAVILLVV